MIKKLITLFIVSYWLLIPFGAFAVNTYVVDINGDTISLTRTDDDFDLNGSDFTIAAWVDADSWAGGGSTAIIMNYDADDNGWKILCQASGADCFIQTDAADNHISTYDMSTNTWYYMAFVNEGTNIKGYFTDVASTTLGIYLDATFNEQNAGTQPFRIGDSNNNFNGQVDEVRIWNVALTQAQLEADFKTEICTPKTGLVAYYKFENDATDSSGNANTLTENGAVAYVTSPAPPFTATCGGGAATPVSAIIFWEDD